MTGSGGTAPSGDEDSDEDLDSTLTVLSSSTSVRVG